ncbi:ABC-F family ATP-binding cassette domain-containing protein [Methyloceanibacter sp.]|uniref:ABC-F family ATP-binding cassette domain-containing protein n=1 Tax=Methyloceanibacter sp. TaxID=1965321 RepID=UPI002D28776A|nr:ATP-binding cassette domain-containing protein [Methyloceanibacter sp.]HZP10608.1 ATP-binding cassette domain-containing protein [Methyloceanibacter sp.]
MAPPLLLLKDIHLTFGSAPLLDGAELSISPGERLCLVGRNGSGKSTLLKIAAGLVEPDRGSRFVQPQATIRYLPQEPDFAGFASTGAFVAAGLAPGDDPNRARYLLQSLGLSGEEEPARLSGGESRRAALARVLAPEPDILLLDEPTNHLDIAAIESLEAQLRASRSAIVIISHDRRFLENLSQATVWLDRGATRRLDKGFAAFEPWRDQILDEEETARHKLERRIVQEEHWLRYGVSARRKRNVRRLDALTALRDQRRREKSAATPQEVKLTLQEAGEAGRKVIEARHIAKNYGGLGVVRDFSTKIARGDKVGIVGPNGAGKTTLVNMLIGALPPDEGQVKLGTNLEIATLDQRRESLDPETSVAAALTGGRGDQVIINGEPRHVIGYMKDFLFKPEQAQSPVKSLSGGERGRLLLARALAKPSNLMVLDEPTNDLDLETLDLLQEMLASYQGTLILVSHDRDFLDRTVTSVIASEGDGRWIEYAGGYSDMVAQRGHGLGAPKREKQAAKRAAKPPLREPRTAQPKKRLNPTEQHVLKTSSARIAALAAEIARLEKLLADPNLYGRDREAFTAAGSALTKAQAELAAAEEEWLRLELLREEIEGA